MIVDVIRMRARGEKVPAGQLKDVAPIRGRLSIKTRPSSSEPAPRVDELATCARLFDHLDDDPIAEPLLVLLEAHVNDLVGEAFVIVGIERTVIDTHERNDAQAWWCRRVGIA
jgi:hypothetical protein